MAQWAIHDKDLLIKSSLGAATAEMIEATVKERNATFKTWRDDEHQCQVYECEQRPVNNHVWGIYWREYKVY